MPKFSVYVPDGLWSNAARLMPDVNPSQLVQVGLQRLVDNAERQPDFAKPPADSGEEIDGLRKRLAAQARALFEDGYREGLAKAQELSWAALNALADANWDPSAIDNPAMEGVLDRLYVKNWALPADSPPSTYWQGFDRALRDLWRAVVAEPWTDESTRASEAADLDAERPVAPRNRRTSKGGSSK